MVTLFITTLIGIGICWYQNYKIGLNDLEDYLLTGLISLFTGVIGLLVGLVLAIAVPMDTYEDKYSMNIENLNDNSSVEGSFFLGCSQFEGTMKYVFYVEEDGFYMMEQLDYELVKIKYSTGKPRVNVTENYPSDSWINNFAIDLDCFSKTYVIEVPEGTIKNNYNLNV